jgi:hypothetical protein
MDSYERADTCVRGRAVPGMDHPGFESLWCVYVALVTFSVRHRYASTATAVQAPRVRRAWCWGTLPRALRRVESEERPPTATPAYARAIPGSRSSACSKCRMPGPDVALGAAVPKVPPRGV